VKRPSSDDGTDDLGAFAEQFWREHELAPNIKFAAMGTLLRLHRVMTAELERALKGYGLTLTAYLVLALVQFSQTASRPPGQIATKLMVHPTTVTDAVERLEAAGYLSRAPHPTDRRAVQVTITPTGTELLSSATRALERLDFGLASLSEHQAAQLSALREPVPDALRDPI
jgi:DNA-binding MarR family transcriptional regulator